MDTGWDTDSDVEDEQSLTLRQSDGSSKVSETAEDDLNDLTDLLPRNCEVRAKQQNDLNAASGKGVDGQGDNNGLSTNDKKRALLGMKITEMNKPRGPVDQAFYKWIREEATVEELGALFDNLPEGKRINEQGRVDGTFTIGLRLVHFKLLDKQGHVGMRVGPSDMNILSALKKVCKVERVRIRGFSSAMAIF